MFYRDVIRAFDSLIGEIDGAGSAQKKTGWMSQSWHRRLTWLRWLREVRAYVENQETMAVARILENERLKAAFAAHCVQCPQCHELLTDGNQDATQSSGNNRGSAAPKANSQPDQVPR